MFGREEKHWPLSLRAKHFSLYIAVMIRISTFLKGAESYELSRVVKNISFLEGKQIVALEMCFQEWMGLILVLKMGFERDS